VQVRDVERNLRSYFRVIVIRVVSKPRTDAARWCAGCSNKYWLIPVVFPKSKGHRSERTSCQSSLSNVCPLLFCVFVFVSVRVSVANFYRSAFDLYMEVYDARVGNVVSDNDSSDDRRANRDRRSMRSASKAAVGRADI
jgi:hypothetical protein